jgi:hypothetical protein
MKKSPMKNVVSYLLFFCLIAGLLSCDKDSNDPTPETPAGVEGSWKITAITVDPAQNGISDLLAFLEAGTGNKCISSTVLTFKGNGTIDAAAPAGCTDTTEGVPDDNSTWKVTGNKIQLKDGTDITEFDLAVSKTEMKWSYQETEDNASYKVTFVFKKQ